MNAELKKKWLEALRSGSYRQATKTLITLWGKCDKFCCLGVLCNIVQPEFDHDVFVNKRGDVMGFPYPEVYEKRAGLSIRDMKYLVAMNDRCESFETIADWIEENL